MGTGSDFDVYPDRAKRRARAARETAVTASGALLQVGAFPRDPTVTRTRDDALRAEHVGPRDVGRSARAFFDAQQLRAAREDHEAGR